MKCFVCDKVYQDPSGLIFSEPVNTTDGEAVMKYHLCRTHFSRMMTFLYFMKETIKEIKDESTRRD